MSDLLSYAKLAGMGTKTLETDEDIVTSVERLISIVNTVTEVYPSFVLEAYVSPMSILQDKTEDIKELGFYVIANQSYDGEATESDVRDLLIELCKSEFQGIESLDFVKFEKYNKWKAPTLCVYSVFENDTIETFEDADYNLLYEIVNALDCYVSVPVDYKWAKTKTMFIHMKSIADTVSIRRKLATIAEENNLVICNVDDYKGKCNIIYSLMLSGRIQYKIPYLYLCKSSFDEQRIMNNSKESSNG